MANTLTVARERTLNRSPSELQRNRAILTQAPDPAHRAGFFFGGVDSDCLDLATWWLHEGRYLKSITGCVR